MKDLLRIARPAAADLARLLYAGDTVRDNPYWHRSLPDGDTVVLYFAKPSTRTRLSFACRLSRAWEASPGRGPAELQLGRGETIEDTARVVSRNARAFVIRTFADDDVAAHPGGQPARLKSPTPRSSPTPGASPTRRRRPTPLCCGTSTPTRGGPGPATSRGAT